MTFGIESNLNQDEIYVVRAADDQGGLTVKRVVVQPDTVVCISDNEVFNPSSIDLDGKLSNVLVRGAVCFGNQPARHFGRSEPAEAK